MASEREMSGMVARVSQTRIDAAQLPEVAELFASIMEAEGREEGFIGGLLLTQREQGVVVSIELHDTMEHLRRTEESGWYQEKVESVGPMLLGTPRRHLYEVVVNVMKGGGRFAP